MADVALKTLDGINCANNLGIILRDLKPAHMLINQQMQVKIIDLGMATMKDPNIISNTWMELPHPPSQKENKKEQSPTTQLRRIIKTQNAIKFAPPPDITQFFKDNPIDPIPFGGTLSYMPKEGIFGEISPLLDRWAWLISIYETASGKHPFEKVTEIDVNLNLNHVEKMHQITKILTNPKTENLQQQFRSANPLVPSAFYTPLCDAIANPTFEQITKIESFLHDIIEHKIPEVITSRTAPESRLTEAMPAIDIATLVKYAIQNNSK